jgi:hypothetical protein
MLARFRGPAFRQPGLVQLLAVQYPGQAALALRCKTHPLQFFRDVRIERDQAGIGRVHDLRLPLAWGQQGYGRGLGAAHEPFAAWRLDGRREGDVLPHQARGDGRRAARAGAVQVVHHVAPHRRRPRDAGHVPHRTPIEVADPDPDRVAVRVADTPVVAHVLAGAGLHRAPEAGRQFVAQAEGHAARAAVGQDVADDEDGLLVEHAVALVRPARAQGHAALHAAVGQRAVGVGQFQQADVGRAERQRIAVEVRRFGQAR